MSKETLPSFFKTNQYIIASIALFAGLAAFFIDFFEQHKNEDIIEWIKNFLGTSFVTKRDPRDGKERLINNRERYILTLSSVQNVGEICKVILPYLKIKKRQAELMVEYCNNHKVRVITDRDLQIVNELRLLNKRGV